VDVLEGDGLLALSGDVLVGLVTWRTDPRDAVAEVRAIAVAPEEQGHGVGRGLLAAAEETLRAAGVGRAWLVTTNDNLAALALYQKAGWRLAELRSGAIDELRATVKPSIAEVGEHGIPIRDELELTKEL
jgi:ribosomal protein S18 acetylase RimI-like enzyme